MKKKMINWLNGTVLVILLVYTLSGLQNGVVQAGRDESADPDNDHSKPVNHIKLGFTERVSVSSDGEQGNSYSGDRSDISANGRYVAFSSLARNLVPGDTNRTYDVFVHDRLTGTTEIVSVASDGSPGNRNSNDSSISANGRYVAFYSDASNLVSEDTNAVGDIFVHDRGTGYTERISVASNGKQANNRAYRPSISPDGRYVTFCSYARNLIDGDTNGTRDVFVHDRLTGETELVSVATDGTQGNDGSLWSSISADGRYVAFWSEASNLVSGDTNGFADIFVHDRITGQTDLVSVGVNGVQGNGNSRRRPTISEDGRFVAFNSGASNLVSDDFNKTNDIFVHDRQTGRTELVSRSSDGSLGNHGSFWSSISDDGRYVTFDSLATNLVSGDTNEDWDVFVHDRQTGNTMRVSVASNGKQGNNSSYVPTISADGHSVVFTSVANNLVPGDTNVHVDVFVHEWIDARITYLPIISR
jgi:archaellum component FlaF (FlaF/FlaG flagellin family)